MTKLSAPYAPTLKAIALVAVACAGFSTTAFAGPGRDMGMGPMQEVNFDLADTDKDGKLTKVEIDVARAARIKAADANADGLLSAEELAAMHIKAMTERATDRASKMVTKLDSDGDKLLSPAEMSASEHDNDMFEKVDTDGDGAITKAEADAAREKMKHRGHGAKGQGPDDNNN